jgi:hypothetical protein
MTAEVCYMAFMLSIDLRYGLHFQCWKPYIAITTYRKIGNLTGVAFMLHTLDLSIIILFYMIRFIEFLVC